MSKNSLQKKTKIFFFPYLNVENSLQKKTKIYSFLHLNVKEFSSKRKQKCIYFSIYKKKTKYKNVFMKYVSMF